ncbi:hypothetical protein [Dawidia soli]|uniref:Uncharacterized protein n=1 Tax=Dawidia soli TaxID=2782352 RepID=A0AAP2GLX7_9BACT|nr:hypothetical protein [Dawidia soli]MBT1690653.1 hypothetical protein [Dawidia soli]
MSSESLIDFSNVPNYTWEDAAYLDYDFHENLGVLKNVVNHHHELITQKQERLRYHVANDEYLTHSTDPEYVKAQYIAHYYDDLATSNTQLEFIVNSASMMAALSVLEAKLKTVCVYIKTELQTRVDPSDMPVPGDLEKLRHYLVTELGSTTSKSDQYVDRVRVYKQIRNVLAHNLFDQTLSVTLKQRLSTVPHVTIASVLGREQLDFRWRDFLLELLNTLGKYFTALLQEADAAIALRRSAATP